MPRLTRSVPLIQGLYYAVTGFWPVVHMPSFLAITGPKADLWLVRATGLLIGVIGITILLPGSRRDESRVAFLAQASALSLAVIDVTYSRRGRISKVYFLDGLLQLALCAAWFLRGQDRTSNGA